MNKENILYGVIGLLLGLIIGFVFANKTNQSLLQPRTGTNAANPNMPSDHPAIDGSQQGMTPQVAEAIKAADEQPNNFEAQMRVASMYYQIQNFDKAVEYLQKANKIRPDDYDSIVQLGNVTFDAQRYEEAEKWYSSALVKKPDDIAVRTDLGLTFFLRTPPDYDKAIKEFEGSLKRDPNHKQTLFNITSSYMKKGEFQKAKEFMERLEKSDPNNAEVAKLRAELDKQLNKQ